MFDVLKGKGGDATEVIQTSGKAAKDPNENGAELSNDAKAIFKVLNARSTKYRQICFGLSG